MPGGEHEDKRVMLGRGKGGAHEKTKRRSGGKGGRTYDKTVIWMAGRFR